MSADTKYREGYIKIEAIIAIVVASKFDYPILASRRHSNLRADHQGSPRSFKAIPLYEEVLYRNN